MYTNIILCLHYVYYYYLDMNIDYILNKSLKIIFSFIIAITLVIISLFAFPPKYAYAAYNVPVSSTVPTKQDIIDNGLPYLNQNDDISYALGSDNTVRISGYKSGSNNYICALTSNRSAYIYTVNTNGNSIGNTNFMYDSSSNSIYYHNLSIFTDSQTDISTNINIYSSKDEMISNYNTIESLEPEGPSEYEGLNIPPGYIARIQVKNGSKFTMVTTMGTDNIAYQDKWVYTSQWYKFNDTSNPETAMETDGITIPWIRYGNTNILGQTNQAQYTINSSVGSYVWILNPAYMVGQNADLYDTKLNSSIKLTNVVDILQVRVFALKSTYTWGGIVSSTSTGSGIEYDPESGNWIDNNGDPVDPVDYGDTNVPTTGTTLIQQFETLLSNLINRIERLLVAPVDYINQLIQSANQFFLWLRGLWSWLPGPVVESISAVLIIMCTVGALKLLWR